MVINQDVWICNRNCNDFPNLLTPDNNQPFKSHSSDRDAGRAAPSHSAPAKRWKWYGNTEYL
jgi:hypothetical protein